MAHLLQTNEIAAANPEEEGYYEEEIVKTLYKDKIEYQEDTLENIPTLPVWFYDRIITNSCLS